MGALAPLTPAQITAVNGVRTAINAAIDAAITAQEAATDTETVSWALGDWSYVGEGVKPADHLKNVSDGRSTTGTPPAIP